MGSVGSVGSVGAIPRSRYKLVLGPSAVPPSEGWFLDHSTGLCDVANPQPAFFMSWSRKYFVVATTKTHARTGDVDVHCPGPGSCNLRPRALE